MSTDLSLIVQLQTHDSGIDDVLGKIAEISAEIKAKNAKMASLKDGLTSAKNTVKTHQAKKKELELEADSKENLIKKHQGELNSLKSNDAYKAMLGEIETAKNSLTELEDRQLEVMEKIDAAEKELKQKEIQLKSDESKIKEDIQKLESEKAKLTDEEKNRRAKRTEYANSVPNNLTTRYEAIRKKKGGKAIVPVINGSCSGCRMGLTPNQGVAVKKATDMVICENCSRILYLPPETSTSDQKSEEASQATPS
jgi:hypothetical protein